jgi:aerobic carbon-monoxide dehydrogenase large subunit
LESAIGKPLRRKEDARLLTGAGRFSDDFGLEGQVHAAMVRSPHAHAAIRKIAVEKTSGVLGVFTGRDCQADRLGPIGHSPMPSTKFDLKLAPPAGRALFFGPHLLLPLDKARHAGEAVAMVVAETRDQALDAAEAVEVEYEPLPSVTHSGDALAAGAPLVWDEAPGNLFIDTWFGDRDAAALAFASAKHAVKMTFDVPRVTACALEPRAALGAFENGRYTLWAPSGGAVRQKRELAALLGVDEKQVRVLTCDVGGNFGSRNRVYVEYGLVLWAARRLGRPVKFAASRAESLVTDYQGRDLAVEIELALSAEGRFLALRSSNLSNAGARCVSLSPLSKGSGLVTGSYDIPAAALRSRAAFTNTAPTNPYRSSGRP